MHRVPSRTVLLSWVALASAPAQSIRCEKFRLDNGMTVILHEDHRVPFVAVNTWFRVGAKDEPAGRSGFAHLFEHLMFMGTARVPGNQFDTIMESGGGFNNASTTEDRTNYFSQGPSSILPTLLWLDADRLEDVGRTMDQQKLDRQREVVRNEIREQVENQPYGRVERVKFNLMFPAGHPYHDSTYGTHADLEAATVDDVRDFFANYYVPNNASLVVAGDFDPAQVKPLVAELFGSLPRAPEPLRRVTALVRLDRVVRATVLDHVQMPLVKMVWHAPPSATAGTAELALLAEILAGGKDSRLYLRLVDGEGVAADVSASFDGLALGSLFEIDVYAVPDADLDHIESVVDEELARVRSDGVGADELERRKTGRELAQITSLQDIARVADTLNRYEFLWGEPDSFARDLARYRAVTTDGVRDIVRSVLDPDRRAILRVVPIDRQRESNSRDERPAGLAVQPFHVEVPNEFRLSNHIRVVHWQRPALPLVSVRLQIDHGGPLIAPGHAAVAALTADMLSEGADDLDAAHFAAELESLGARFTAWIDHETANAALFVLRRNFGPSLHRLADAVRRPRMLEADFDRARRVRLAMLQAEDEQPESVASRVAMRVLFGDSDPYGWPAGGTVETVSTATLNQVRDEYRALFAPEHATILIAGDLSLDEARAALELEFGDWRPAEGARAMVTTLRVPVRQDLRVVVVDRPGAAQTVIQLMAPAPTYTDPARIRLQALSTLLGGSFTSRLNQNLREQHGYSYGAGAAFSLGPWRGWFSASASVQTAVTGPALKEMLGELARLRRGEGGDVSPDEARKVGRTLHAQVVESTERLDGLLATAAELVLNRLAFDQVGKDVEAIDGISADALNASSRNDLDIDHGVLVLVGDRETILAQIDGLGLPPSTERDPRGAVVSR